MESMHRYCILIENVVLFWTLCVGCLMVEYFLGRTLPIKNYRTQIMKSGLHLKREPISFCLSPKVKSYMPVYSNPAHCMISNLLHRLFSFFHVLLTLHGLRKQLMGTIVCCL